MDRTKKYLRESQTPHLDIGRAIEQILKEKNLTHAEVARRVGVHQSAFKRYLGKPSMQVGVLWNVSLALDYNFFGDVMSDLPEKVFNNNNAPFFATLQEQAKTIEDLKKEIEIYKNTLKLRL